MRILIALILLLGNLPAKADTLSAKDIIEKSQKFHDPEGKWDSVIFRAHIQEPRIGNPYRYSIVEMNLGQDSFELSRNRGERISTHIIESNGESMALLDGQPVDDEETLKQFRLNPEMNNLYKSSYFFRFGMPMSLTEEAIENYGAVSKTTFNDKDAFKVEVELKEPQFSKYWTVFFAEDNYELLGVEITFPDDPTKGERLYYEGEYTFDGITIPRVTHWHDYDGDAYAGSDIIVKPLPD